ncbi:MAG TPA: ACT domain-containing protein [Pontiella sp.]
MKNTFIAMVIGPESPDIIKALAQTTHELGGVWMRSKVTKMDGQFSALIKVSIAEDKVDVLKAAFRSDFTALHFEYAGCPQEQGQSKKSISLEVDSKDRPGLVKDINDLLLNLDMKVVNMESHRFEVAEIGGAVFSAKLDLEVPESTSAESVATEIETLDDSMRVLVL